MRNAQQGTKPTGRHPQHRLTTLSIRAKKRPGRYADGHGLYLVVDPSGASRWIWRGVIRGKRCDLGLGSAQLVTLSDARDKALAYRRLARSSGDPRTTHRRDERPMPTFKDAAVQVHREHSKTFKNAKHAAQWLASLEHDVFPRLGQRPVDTIGAADVLQVLTPIWTTKPETARRLKQRIKLVFKWAKASGFCTGDNPTEGLTQVLPKDRAAAQHHAALPYVAVPAFVTALQTIDDMQPAVRLGLEFLILTAARTNEVLWATWDEIDRDASTWTIPSARMKSNREHRVPLSVRALAVLDEARARQRAGSSLIFPGSKLGQPLSNMTFLKAARRLTTVTITTHGFRSSFRDWCEERTNVPRTVSEAALAHVIKDKAEAAYRRTDLFDKRRDLMAQWSRFATSTPASVTAIGTATAV